MLHFRLILIGSVADRLAAPGSGKMYNSVAFNMTDLRWATALNSNQEVQQ